jgi:hypothetical protein
MEVVKAVQLDARARILDVTVRGSPARTPLPPTSTSTSTAILLERSFSWHDERRLCVV